MNNVHSKSLDTESTTGAGTKRLREYINNEWRTHWKIKQRETDKKESARRFL